MSYGILQEESPGMGMSHREFVPVTFAQDMASAERLQAQLEQQNVPAMLDDLSAADDVFAALGRGVPILVPEHMHERASEIVADSEGGVEGVVCAVDDDEEDDEFFEDDDEDELDDDLDDDDDDDDLDDDDDDLDADFDDLDDLDDDYEEEEDDDDDDYGADDESE